MCTVSWRREPAGYDLFFNRDELNTRAPETPPEPARHRGVDFLAPRDGDHGGTWLLVNEFGLTVCLLNDYASPWQPPATGRTSRGHLVLACAAAKDPVEVASLLEDQPLANTLPFRLLALSPDDGAFLFHWQGTTLTQDWPIMPLVSSSSFATDEVVAARMKRFAAYTRSSVRPWTVELAAYHREHLPRAGAHSVLMHRPDAATRSITHVAVRGDRVDLHYESVRWTPAGPALASAPFRQLRRRNLAALVA